MINTPQKRQQKTPVTNMQFVTPQASPWPFSIQHIYGTVLCLSMSQVGFGLRLKFLFSTPLLELPTGMNATASFGYWWKALLGSLVFRTVPFE